MVRVLFVCMGNICRSPTAEGAFQALLRQQGLGHCVEIDSAGTHAFHVGEPPDLRAQAAARARGIELADLRARRIAPSDFESFDLIVAMDKENHDALLTRCPNPAYREKVRLLMEFDPSASIESVPDPYYGGAIGFERVLDLVEQASIGLLAYLRRKHRLK